MSASVVKEVGIQEVIRPYKSARQTSKLKLTGVIEDYECAFDQQKHINEARTDFPTFRTRIRD